MNLQINFHQIDSTEAIKQKIQSKCEKLNKFFEGSFDIKWTCSTGKEGHHSHAIIAGNGFTINADSTKDDLYKTFDDVITKVERQLSKKKVQMKDKIHRKHDLNINTEPQVDEDED
jgi:putative sigma-54 modulation protein